MASTSLQPPHEQAAPPPICVDLLQAAPAFRIDYASIDKALLFAFAGSTSGGLFSQALEQASMPPSCWQPDGYADELFVAEFVQTCLVHGQPLLAPKHLVRVLVLPPQDEASMVLRRGIVSELRRTPTLVAAVEELYAAVSRFRCLIEGNSAADRWDPNQRQLAILTAYAHVVELAAERFAQAESGLSRVAAYGARVVASEGFAALRDLLAYDDCLATVSFRVRIGADGRVRDLELLAVEENDDNPFVNPPMRRWQAKLELLLRGMQFLLIFL